jgi:hypothetical protein
MKLICCFSVILRVVGPAIRVPAPAGWGNWRPPVAAGRPAGTFAMFMQFVMYIDIIIQFLQSTLMAANIVFFL